MKSAVKNTARKTNNQASFGQSLLKNDMEVEAAMELSRPLRAIMQCKMECNSLTLEAIQEKNIVVSFR